MNNCYASDMNDTLKKIARVLEKIEDKMPPKKIVILKDDEDKVLADKIRQEMDSMGMYVAIDIRKILKEHREEIWEGSLL